MHEKNLVLVLTTNQEYIRHTGEEEQKFAAELNYFFNSISDTYLPLLRMFENLERDNVNFSLSLVIILFLLISSLWERERLIPSSI